MAAESNPSVYAIENTENGKRYIGGSSYPAQRWSEHKKNLRKNRHSNGELQKDWIIFGEHCFKFQILERVNKESLSEREDYYIKSLKNLYNVLSGFAGRLDPNYSFEYKDTRKSPNPQKYTPAKKSANSRGTNKRQTALEARASQFGFDSASAMDTAIINGAAIVNKIEVMK